MHSSVFSPFKRRCEYFLRWNPFFSIFLSFFPHLWCDEGGQMYWSFLLPLGRWWNFLFGKRKVTYVHRVHLYHKSWVYIFETCIPSTRSLRARGSSTIRHCPWRADINSFEVWLCWWEVEFFCLSFHYWISFRGQVFHSLVFWWRKVGKSWMGTWHFWTSILWLFFLLSPCFIALIFSSECNTS